MRATDEICQTCTDGEGGTYTCDCVNVSESAEAETLEDGNE